MKELNIAMVAACPFPGNRGTPSRILRMAEGLSDLGHNIHVVTYHFGTDTVTKGIKIHRIPKIINYNNFAPGPTVVKLSILDPLLFFKLLKTVKTEKIHLIHAHHFEGALVSYAVRALTGVKVVYDAHTTLMGELPSYNFCNIKKVSSFIDYHVPRLADFNITVSDELKEMVSNMGISNDKIEVIPTGVNLETFENRNPYKIYNKYGLGSKKLIIYTGSLAEFQGVGFLLKAMSEVLKEVKDSILLLVGNTNVSKYTKMSYELGIQDNVLFTGERPFSEVPDFLATADVAVIPRTNCPGIPQKLTNYMAAEKAIVCFEGSAKLLSNGQNGLIVRNGDTKQLADAIIKVLKNRELMNELGMNAKRTIIGKYDWDTLCRMADDVYQKVLSI
jgi:glycosyltransferase involved in cell wall biosynthesis